MTPGCSVARLLGISLLWKKHEEARLTEYMTQHSVFRVVRIFSLSLYLSIYLTQPFHHPLVNKKVYIFIYIRVIVPSFRVHKTAAVQLTASNLWNNPSQTDKTYGDNLINHFDCRFIQNSKNLYSSALGECGHQIPSRLPAKSFHQYDTMMIMMMVMIQGFKGAYSCIRFFEKLWYDA